MIDFSLINTLLAGLIVWGCICFLAWTSGYVHSRGFSSIVNYLNLNLGRKLWVKEFGRKEAPVIFLREIPNKDEYYVKFQNGSVGLVSEFEITRKEPFYKHLYKRLFKDKLKTLGLDE